ncbi:MAG: 50S ribosomal protein L17 [Candidatus Omnitrophica bacterium]|nr:50S ribosomal protein L17 [Candidatus Omnitrophota bacterium]
MRHSKKRLQLNRFTSWHEATVKSLARSVLIYQAIRTTLDRAKAARSLVERLISLAKKNTLSGKREAYRMLGDHKLVALLFNEIGVRFNKRASGFTRIINLGRRRGDNAKVVIFELTEKKIKQAKKPKKLKETKVDQAEEAAGLIKEKSPEEKKPESVTLVKEKPWITKKPAKKFLGGIKNIFKKKSDSL